MVLPPLESGAAQFKVTMPLASGTPLTFVVTEAVMLCGADGIVAGVAKTVPP
jgi:hypothetical protein